jgi:arylsulfatase A-like enzyme
VTKEKRRSGGEQDTMDVKRYLIENLPPWAKSALARPYDIYQTRKADSEFAAKDLVKREPSDDAPRHILWVVVDALRTDHVDRETTPYLNSLDGANAVTPGAWTFPAVSSLLSGAYPHEHGAMKQTDEPDNSEGLTLPPRMEDSRETITEVLAGAGYETYGGFGHDTPFVALSGRFDKHALYHKVNSDARDVLNDYLDWVEGRERTFAFLHLADPHIPVDPPDEYWEKYDVDGSIDEIENWDYQNDVDCDNECKTYRENRRKLYRASVNYVDDELSRFGNHLSETVDEPFVFVTSDHGEAMWEHVEIDVEKFDGTGCVDHGGAPYEELARVPVLYEGDIDLAFDGGYVSLIDLHATVLDVVGLNDVETNGYSLVGGVPEDRAALVEGSLNGHEKKGVYLNGYKLIASEGDDVEIGLTVPDEEPTEVPEATRRDMLENLPPWPGQDGDTQTDVSGVVEDRLETLGYK